MKIKYLALAIAATALAPSAFAADITINLAGVHSAEGKIMAQLFAGKDNYKNGVPYSALWVRAKNGETRFVFADLAPGEYAIQIFHDENDNNEMESNAFGIPTEGFAFSNDAKANFGPPSYDDMKVILDKDSATTIANMNY